jgi:LDH2 family malate/lactate/ureidoglycolate dehydrogenase
MTESETLALIAWYLGSIRQKEPFTKAQETVWTELLVDTDPRDARAALDRMLETGEFVTPQRIGELAISTRFERLEAEGSSRPALPPERDNRPPCCIEAEGSLAHWLAEHATEEEREKAQKFGVGEVIVKA